MERPQPAEADITSLTRGLVGTWACLARRSRLQKGPIANPATIRGLRQLSVGLGIFLSDCSFLPEWRPRTNTFIMFLAIAY